jgi:hypothetical protein
MLYDAPSPRNTNHQGLFLSEAGRLVDKHGRDWGKSQIARMALDALPESARDLPQPELSEAERGEIDEHERVKKLCVALEAAMEKLNLRPEYKGALLKVIEQHKKHDWRENRNGAKDSRKGRARDEESGPDPEKFKLFLKGAGFSDEDVADALRIAGFSKEPAEDRLPRNALSGDSSATFARYPDLARVGPGTPPERPLSAADKRLAYDRANAETRLEKRFPMVARVVVDPYHRR